MAWQGFDGRALLTHAEWETYRRRPPVRYARRGAHPMPEKCEVCGDPWTDENTPQISHRIPFLAGVVDWGLTPEWLDHSDNLKWAHKRICNKKVELNDDEIAIELHRLGISDRRGQK